MQASSHIIRRWLRAIVLSSGLLWVITAQAQVSPQEHAGHHPQGGQVPGGQAATPSPPAGPGGVMGGKGGREAMMGPPGAAPPKELYPSLMDLPDLSPGRRADIERLAQERMQTGTAQLAAALERLSGAASKEDYSATQEATIRLRAALEQFESGLAVQRALAEGKTPRNVALQWFKRDMNLLPPPGADPAQGALGLPPRWFHYVIIAILTGFFGGMAWMYFHKMRRAEALFLRLASGAAASPDRSDPGASAAGPPPVPPPGPPSTPSAPAAPADSGETLPPPAAPADSAATSAVLPQGKPPGKWTGALRVARIFEETPDTKTFRLVNPDGGPLPFTSLPGQYLTLTVKPAEKPVKRSYTIASSPTERDYLEITVKREAFGLISRYLHDRVNAGDGLAVTGASGYFTFTGQEAASIVLIGGGVGITPMMSVIRYLTARGWPGDIFLLYSCRTPSDFVFREELEYLQRRHPNLHVFPTITRADGAGWMGPRGHLTREFIATAVPAITSRRTLLCGPVPMMDAIRQMLVELGVPTEQIKTENFGTAKRAPSASPLPQAGPVEVKPQAAKAIAGATVRFARSGTSAPLPPDRTILEAAETIGVEIDNSCRSGTCGSCKVKRLSGSVTMEVQDGLEPGDKAQNIILACQAKSTGDVAVEA